MLVMDPTLLDDVVEELPLEFENYEDEVAFKEQLRGWSDMYGSIFMVELNEVVFFFKALTRGEMEVAKTVCKDDYERLEYICKTCIIEPVIEDYSLEIYAGIPEVLSGVILDESGFTSAEKIKVMIAKWERYISDVENQIPLVIKEVFQDIPLKEIESWPMDRISEYYVKAKWTMENLRNMKLTSNEEG